MGKMQDEALKALSQEERGDVIDVTDPANKEIMEMLDKRVQQNVMMISQLQTVPTPDSDWEPLLQHGGFMLGVDVRTRATKLTIIMDARGKMQIRAFRDGAKIGELEIEVEQDIPGYDYGA